MKPTDSTQEGRARTPRRWSLVASLPLLAALSGGFGGAIATAYAGSYRGGRNRSGGIVEIEWPAGTELSTSPARAPFGAGVPFPELTLATAPEMPAVAESSLCEGETISLTVTTLADELYGGTESVASPDGAGLSLREAVALGESCSQSAFISFAPSLAGGLIRRAHPGDLIDIGGGPEAGITTIDGDIDGDGKPDILLSNRALETDGGNDCPDPRLDPNVLILVDDPGEPDCDVGSGGASWGHIARVHGVESKLRLTGVVLFDSEIGPSGLLWVDGAGATLWLERALVTGCHGDDDYPQYTNIVEVRNQGRLELRNVAMLGNHEAFSLAGYAPPVDGAISVWSSTLIHGEGYAWFISPVYVNNSVVLGKNAGQLRSGSNNNVIVGDPAEIVEIHSNGTPSMVLRSHPANPALDAGDNLGLQSLGITTDLFGNPRFVDGDADGTATADIGAVELQDPPYQDVDAWITKTDGRATVAPGEEVVYEITVGNDGPDDVVGAAVQDPFPTGLNDCSWLCVTSGGGSCDPASGSGDVDTELDLPAGTLVVVQATCTVDPSFAGSSLENVAGLALPEIHVDATTADDLATDVTEVTPCGEENDKVLPAQTVPDTQIFEACRTLTAGSGFGVGATGDVALRAGEKVILDDGFSVETGGSLTIEIDPTLAGE